jgi:hypothetical protein
MSGTAYGTVVLHAAQKRRLDTTEPPDGSRLLETLHRSRARRGFGFPSREIGDAGYAGESLIASRFHVSLNFAS